MIKLKEICIILLLYVFAVSCACTSKVLTMPEFMNRHKNIEATIDSFIPLVRDKDFILPYGCENGYTLTITNIKENFQKTVFITNCEWTSLKDDFGIDYEICFEKHIRFDKVKTYKLIFRKL